MFILGLGANLGNPLSTFRKVIRLLNNQLKVIAVSPIYESNALLPNDAPKAWDISYLNLAVACESTTVAINDVFKIIKDIEIYIGRKSTEIYSPRLIDIDILAWDKNIVNQNNLCIPHARLCDRPFALWPLLDLQPNWRHPTRDIEVILQTWGSRFSGEAPLKTRQIPHRVDTSCLVGILNITDDSFSDGKQFNTLEKAFNQAKKLFDEGAEVIDIGAESVRPNSTGTREVTLQKEWERLEPIINAIKFHWQSKTFKPKISIDTRSYEIAENAINLGVDWINDVTGFSDLNMRSVVSSVNVDCVVMHNLGLPPQARVLSDTQDTCFQIIVWAEKRLQKLLELGIKAERLIFDPGIGFGKTAKQSIEVLKNINQFQTLLQSLNVSLLIGHSRKSFMNVFTEKLFHERDLETSILSFYLASQPIVDYLRVHNVATNAQALKIAANLK